MDRNDNRVEILDFSSSTSFSSAWSGSSAFVYKERSPRSRDPKLGSLSSSAPPLPPPEKWNTTFHWRRTRITVFKTNRIPAKKDSIRTLSPRSTKHPPPPQQQGQSSWGGGGRQQLIFLTIQLFFFFLFRKEPEETLELGTSTLGFTATNDAI